LKRSQSVAHRSITSVTWNIAANLVRIAVLFARSVLLARLLPVDTFGVYAWAGAIVGLTMLVAKFGMDGAFLHRAPESQDETQTAAVHFTLSLVFSVIWTVLMVGASAFLTGQTRTALLVLTAARAGLMLVDTPRMILVRRVVHRRLALIVILNAIFSTLVAVGLAWSGATLWALLSTDFVALAVNILMLYVWRPVWRPRLAWSPPVVRYFLGFGSRNFLAQLLRRALDQVDDLWAGFYLGTTSLGYYSRAYTFATYPRQILAVPLNTVTGGSYAELKESRRQLSQMFFRVNAFLVRSGFFLAGLLALVAPEFIRLFLGEKWLPMLGAFRLMLIFTLLDPIKTTVANLFVAVGRPEQVVRARLVQLGVLAAGLYLLGLRLDIAGVALAVDVMLVVGMMILLWQARAYVDISYRQLFLVPTLALTLGLVLGYGLVELLGIRGSDWWTGLIKTVSFSAAYGLVFVVLERQQILEMVLWARSYFQQRREGELRVRS
jgi:PST family polysaccharide transporter